MSGAAAARLLASVEPRHRLLRLSVRDFRNLHRVEVIVPPDGLVIVGENGHGKTNLLEAVYYLQLLRSMRGARDQDLIRFESPAFHLSAETFVGGEHQVAVGFERAGRRKRVRLDGSEPDRLSDAIGALPSVIVAPRDVGLVAGAPSERRRYLDIVLALTSRRYLLALQRYRAALARRNAALRDVVRHGRDDARVAVWEPALAEHGAVLWTERLRWIGEVERRFTELCAAIGERGTVRLRYLHRLEPTADPAGVLADALASRRALDIRRGVTHVGPHRDDLELKLESHDLRTFGSAGQHRTAAIALRMLEAHTLRARGGGVPLLLLDDPFAELDTRRSGRVLELLADAGLGQTLLAVPRETDIPPELTRLERRFVRDGRVTDRLSQ